MIRLVLITFFLTFQFSAIADADQRRSDLIKIIEEELNEVVRLNRQTNEEDVVLMLRMAELWLEKARILKEKENQLYLEISNEKRRTINKREHFANSYASFNEAQKICQLILRKGNRSKVLGDVYYVLAYNAKEFGDHDQARKYFIESVRNSKKNSVSSIKSQLALAEIHFNESNYKKAIPLYERALQYSQQFDRWWTKDTFNLAWCYFRAGKKNKAISKMELVYQKSSDAKYIDMKEAVIRDLGYFYISLEKIDTAIDFYKKAGGDVSGNLLMVSSTLFNNAKFVMAEKTIAKIIGHMKEDTQRAKIYIMLLHIYEKYGKYKEHLETSERLNELYKKKALTSEQVENYIYHLKRLSATLQQQVIGKAYANLPKQRMIKAKLASRYFEMLAEVVPKERHKSLFHAGETNFVVKNYDEAISFYQVSLVEAEKRNDRKISTLSLNGLMASLGSVKEKSVQEKYLASVYGLYLQRDPNSKKSFIIYQRLFNFHFNRNHFEDAEKTLEKFRVNFPDAVLKQEAMIAKMMEYYQKKKDIDGIRSWVKKINSGKYQVSQKYAKNVNQLMLTLQFEDVEKSNNVGDKKKALVGYVAIYRSNDTTKYGKMNAAYNIAVLFSELGDLERGYLWVAKALELMDSTRVVKFSSSFILIANQFFERNRAKQSEYIYYLALSKSCEKNFKQKETFFRNGSLAAIESGINNDRIFLLKDKCRIDAKTVSDVEKIYYRNYFLNENYGELEKLIATNVSNENLVEENILYSGLLAAKFRDSGRDSRANVYENKAMELFQKFSRVRLGREALDIIGRIEVAKLEMDIDTFNSLKLQFPENIYNQTLKEKFSQIDLITARGIKIMNLKSGEGVIGGYRALTLAYESLATEIHNFTPTGKGPAYVETFKNSMGKFVESLRSKGREFRQEAKKHIIKENIASPYNHFFFVSENTDSFVMYKSKPGVVIMDRGGI